MKKRIPRPVVFFLIIFLLTGLYLIKSRRVTKNLKIVNANVSVPSPSPFQSSFPSASPSATPKAGPCIKLPVLFYHHIQTKEASSKDHQSALSVFTPIFEEQMQYLKFKNYNVIKMADLISFFDSGAEIPPKSIILTFDDGYQDFYTDAYPILQKLGFASTMFVSTGLVETPDYLTWDEISGMSNVLFANHTLSHKNVGIATKIIQNEISTADIQLADKGLGSPRVFAYPYGSTSLEAENYLNSLSYKLAFTTKPGDFLCKGLRFELPRVRIENSPLSSYGF